MNFILLSTTLVIYGIRINDKFTVSVHPPASTHLDVASGFWHPVFYQQTYVSSDISVQNRLDLLRNYREMIEQIIAYKLNTSP